LCKMITVSGIPVMSTNQIIGLGSKELVSCTCQSYLHYVLCKHIFLILMECGIISGYPKTMDPRPINTNLTSGRPVYAKRGGANQYD
jgi:hypothetical protein